MSETYIKRHAEVLISEALQGTPIVLVSGPRQSGKTTLVEQYVTEQRPYITLDDSGTLEAARRDPTGFIRSLGSAVIDEIQRAPELLLAIKIAVDMDKSPGRFLLTGSANVMTLPAIGDALAGRIAIVELLPLSQAELHGTTGALISHLFASGPLTFAPRPEFGAELHRLILAGGYPEPLQRESARRSAAWFDDYVRMVVDRDARESSNIEQLEQLPRLVPHLAEQAGQAVNISNLASALQLSRQTVIKYIEALERIYMVRALPPWFSDRVSRLVKTPKVQFFDSGLLAALRGVNQLDPLQPPAVTDALFETFVHAELRKLMSWSEVRTTLCHFRTREQEEVDFVIEDARGRVVGIEIKSGATLRRSDFSGLRKLEAAARERFVRGLILHDHDSITPVSEKIQAAPLSLLWTL